VQKRLQVRKKLKVFLKAGKVHVEKINKQLMAIENDDDLKKLESYVEQLHMPDPQQSSSTTNRN